MVGVGALNVLFFMVYELLALTIVIAIHRLAGTPALWLAERTREIVLLPARVGVRSAITGIE